MVLLPIAVGTGGGPRNLVWFALLAGFVIYGLKKLQSAHVLASILFFAVWSGVSVHMRNEVAAIEQAGDAAVRKPDRVGDPLLDRFIRAFSGGGDLLEKTPEMAAGIAILCGRIDRIADPRVAATIRTHGRVSCRTSRTN